MESKRRRIFLAVLFILSIGNFTRIDGSNDIRTVMFLAIFAIGILFGLLVKEVIDAYKDKQQK